MTDEQPTLLEMIEATISEYCASRGLGMPLGFIYCVAHIDANGEKVMTLGECSGQLTAFSIGMAEYLKQTFRLDAEAELTAWTMHNEED